MVNTILKDLVRMKVSDHRGPWPMPLTQQEFDAFFAGMDPNAPGYSYTVIGKPVTVRADLALVPMIPAE